jgi:hypothetical protein
MKWCLGMGLAAALILLGTAAPSYGAEIRYDFTGYVPDLGYSLPPPYEPGYSLKPGSPISGYFSYIQENAVLLVSGTYEYIYLGIAGKPLASRKWD